VLNAYKVDDCRVELTLQPPPARAVHSNTREISGASCKATWHRRESAGHRLTRRVGGGAGAEVAKQEGATGWLQVGRGSLFVQGFLSVAAKNNPGSRCLSARAALTKRDGGGNESKAARPRAVFEDDRRPHAKQLYRPVQ
jgi:hypothetical protein